jgi:hypothetical protein
MGDRLPPELERKSVATREAEERAPRSAISVVTKDLPSHCMAAGAPARVVRSWG